MAELFDDLTLGVRIRQSGAPAMDIAGDLSITGAWIAPVLH